MTYTDEEMQRIIDDHVSVYGEPQRIVNFNSLIDAEQLAEREAAAADMQRFEDSRAYAWGAGRVFSDGTEIEPVYDELDDEPFDSRSCAKEMVKLIGFDNAPSTMAFVSSDRRMLRNDRRVMEGCSAWKLHRVERQMGGCTLYYRPAGVDDGQRSVELWVDYSVQSGSR